MYGRYMVDRMLPEMNERLAHLQCEIELITGSQPPRVVYFANCYSSPDRASRAREDSEADAVRAPTASGRRNPED